MAGAEYYIPPPPWAGGTPIPCNLDGLQLADRAVQATIDTPPYHRAARDLRARSRYDYGATKLGPSQQPAHRLDQGTPTSPGRAPVHQPTPPIALSGDRTTGTQRTLSHPTAPITNTRPPTASGPYFVLGHMTLWLPGCTVGQSGHPASTPDRGLHNCKQPFAATSFAQFTSPPMSPLTVLANHRSPSHPALPSPRILESLQQSERPARDQF